MKTLLGILGILLLLSPLAGAYQYDYCYQLTINLTKAKISEHNLQPVKLNISALNGTNIPALMVVCNYSGILVEQDWEWFHQRNDTNDKYANQTIRFRVNCVNNTLQKDYFIYTTDDPTIPTKNTTIFQFYDGFEVGNVNGWVSEPNVTFQITEISANGNYAGNKSDRTDHYEAYYDFPFDLNNKDSISICWFTRMESNVSVAIPYMLQNNTSDYATEAYSGLETWYFHRIIPAALPYQILLYDDNIRQPLIPLSLKKWYAWCWKNIDTRGEDVSADFWINGKLHYADASGLGIVDTIDGISFAWSGNRGRLVEAYIDEVYVSLDYDYNIYQIKPKIVIGTEKAAEEIIILLSNTNSNPTNSNRSCVIINHENSGNGDNLCTFLAFIFGLCVGMLLEITIIMIWGEEK